MALKDTSKEMRSLLEIISDNLEKADNGNKAAAQRVRTSSIRLEKVAKLYRKESIKAEKSGNFKKTKGSSKGRASDSTAKKMESMRSETKAKAGSRSKKVSRSKPAAVAQRKSSAKKSPPAKAKKVKAKAKPMSKKPTAKLLKK
jgi:hypothetical protein